MLKFTENFSMTFAENRTYGVPEFAGTEVNRHSGKLKGLSGYLQNHHDTKGLSRASSSSGVSQDPIFLLNFFEQQSEQKIQHISIQQHCKDEEQFYSSPFIYNSIFGHTNFWNNSNLNCISGHTNFWNNSNLNCIFGHTNLWNYTNLKYISLIIIFACLSQCDHK